MKNHTNQCGILRTQGVCTCEEPKLGHTVLVPSGDVAEAFQLAINRTIHDAWQEGYQQGMRDSSSPPEPKEARLCYQRHEVMPGVHQDIPHEACSDPCPPYCTKHNHEEMGG